MDHHVPRLRGFWNRESEPRQGQNHIQRNGRSEKEERSDHWEIEIPIGIFPTGKLWRTGVLDSDESNHRIRAAAAPPRGLRGRSIQKNVSLTLMEDNPRLLRHFEIFGRHRAAEQPTKLRI